jgi:hypothetical protein
LATWSADDFLKKLKRTHPRGDARVVIAEILDIPNMKDIDAVYHAED